MPTYTNSANVYSELPPNLPTTVTDYTANDIATASGLVESGVGPGFSTNYKSNTQKFPDITDSPATPAIIEIAARFYAASLQYKRLGESVGEGEIPKSQEYWEKAEAIVKDIREGVRTVEIDGTNLERTSVEWVEDEIYEDLTADQKPIFNHNDLDTHLP